MSKSYNDLINVPTFGKKRESTFNPERGSIAFWCKDCRMLIRPIELPPEDDGKQIREYVYECPSCNGRSIALGTEEGLKSHYQKK